MKSDSDLAAIPFILGLFLAVIVVTAAFFVVGAVAGIVVLIAVVLAIGYFGYRALAANDDQ